MRSLPFLSLFVTSLLSFGVMVYLSLVPVNPHLANRNMYIVFILYGSVFLLLGILMQAVAIPVFFDTWFHNPANRRRRLLVFVIPVLMTAYFLFVIATGS